MAVCTGRGDRDGGHCCWIMGEECEFLVRLDDRVRCGKWDSMGDAEWQNAPVGQFFARAWPGFTCIDWPQNIPGVLEAGRVSGGGLCCWQNEVT